MLEGRLVGKVIEIPDILVGSTIIFIILKLVGIIGWSWWWVTSPITAPIVLGILLLISMELFSKYID